MKLPLSASRIAPHLAIVGWIWGPATYIAVAMLQSGPAAARAEDPPAAPAFEPGQISVGEPIPLPFAPPPDVAAAATDAVEKVPRTPQPAALSLVPGDHLPAASPTAAGTGWLGLVVAESRTPGRWMVAEVAPGSPAAVAGIEAGDDVRAINGTLLRNAEDVSQTLTSIAPGQQIGVAVARGDSVRDFLLKAVPRPAPVASRDWQPSPAPTPVETTTPPAVATPAAVPERFPAPAATRTILTPPVTPPVEPPARLTGGLPPSDAPPAASVGRGRTALGVRTVPIDPGTQARFRLPQPSGAYVIGVVQDLPAAKAGLPPGSVIVAIDNRPVVSPNDLTRMVTSGPVGRPVSLQYILPGGESKQAEVVLQSLELPLERALVGPEPVPASTVPSLVPGGPTVPGPIQPVPGSQYANRPAATNDAALLRAARAEIRLLRERLESLERRLEAR
jgi:S1-C subfamily serine protease